MKTLLQDNEMFILGLLKEQRQEEKDRCGGQQVNLFPKYLYLKISTFLIDGKDTDKDVWVYVAMHHNCCIGHCCIISRVTLARNE